MFIFRILQNREKGSDSGFRPGEIVEVRSLSEILKTLDENGTLEGLPFMPEMKKYCGSCFTVLKRVDNVLIEGFGMRRIRNTVILAGVTCDGTGHRGCQRTCPILWKKAWLKRVDSATCEESTSSLNVDSGTSTLPTQVRLCQLANLKAASQPPRSPIGLVQYLSDKELNGLTRPLLRFLRFSLLLWRSLLRRVARSSPQNVEMLRGSLRRTPVFCLNLKPGEHVEVKTEEEIVDTLDSNGRNRGLAFTPEMLRYCGRQYRVLTRIDKMIDQNNGRMRLIRNTVLLEDVVCDGRFHNNCPLNCYCLWREAWLKRVK